MYKNNRKVVYPTHVLVDSTSGRPINRLLTRVHVTDIDNINMNNVFRFPHYIQLRSLISASKRITGLLMSERVVLTIANSFSMRG